MNNAEFLQPLANRLSAGEVLWGLSKSDVNSKGGDWQGAPISSLSEMDRYSEYNNYYVISSFKANAKQQLFRRYECFSSLLCIVLDDIGTKVPFDKVALQPTWIIETSPNNFQYGYLLEEPYRDVDDAKVFIEGLANNGYTDSGAKNPVRLFRLPVGVNNKSIYPEGTRTQLVEYHPQREFTMDQLKLAFPFNESLQVVPKAPVPPSPPALSLIQTSDVNIKRWHEECRRYEDSEGRVLGGEYGGSRHEAIVNMAGEAHALGFDQATAINLILEWNQRAFIPKEDAKEINHQVNHTYKTRKNEAGHKTASHAFKDAPAPPKHEIDSLVEQSKVVAANAAKNQPLLWNKKKAEIPRPSTIDTFPIEILNEFADWFDGCHARTTHDISMLATISLAGVLAGRRYRTDRNNYSNLFALVVAKTGAGKDYVRSGINQFLAAGGDETKKLRGYGFIHKSGRDID